jgi:tyrosinase
MYLACFEQIVADAVRKLGGMADWSLPYWNYSAVSNPNARKVPPAFYSLTLPDGRSNPLRVEQRSTECNLGNEIADKTEVDVSVCLSEPRFPAEPTGGSHGFGGPETKFNHSQGRVGGVEQVPHNTIHGAVGGNNGWMSAFETAALDPIFWLHHCNIDRLWEVWRLRDSSHSDPVGGPWSSLSFEFHDGGGNIVKFTAGEVVDTTIARLGYQYEDVSDPLPAALQTEASRAKALMVENPVPEMVGATERPIKLSRAKATASLSISTPTGPARAGFDALVASSHRRAYLNIENVVGTGVSTYRVYLNLPVDANPRDHEGLFAGVLPTFGVREASRRDKKHTGSGLHYSLEVTDIIRRLSQQKDWNPKSLRVTFVPKGPDTEAADIQVGRVSLYYV